MKIKLWCVHLTAIKPGTGQRQKVIVNQVPAEHDEQARDDAVMRFCQVHPECYDSVRYVSARRTDDAFWNGEA